MQNHISYRPDIDGLRAVAVVSVVVFHAFPGTLKGGFFGVDIFFVISGFLISGIILSGLDYGNFSLANFYGRRIRRIFPALILVLTACLACGWHELLADEYQRLGNNVAAAAIFGSNILLWRETGYFDVESATKPLLHLWSLGVEEQFYLVWPLMLVALWKTRHPLAWILALAAASLALALTLAAYSPVTGFYLPISRMWELLGGAALAYNAHHRLDATNHAPSQQNTVSIIGTALILGPVCFGFVQSFPILPAIGALLILHAGKDAWINRYLSHQSATYVGLISYPLYLWHWPLLSVARIMLSGEPSTAMKLELVVTAFALAAITYHFVEIPIRYRKHAASLRLVTCSLVLLLASLGTIGGWISTHGGLPQRFGFAPPPAAERILS